MEYAAWVNEASANDRKGQSYALIFLSDESKIEAAEIVTAEIAPVEKSQNRVGHCSKLWQVGDILVPDAVNLGGSGRDGNAGIDAPGAVLGLPSGHEFQNADFDDSVGLGIGAGRFKVEDRERPFEDQIIDHGSSRGTMGIRLDIPSL